MEIERLRRVGEKIFSVDKAVRLIEQVIHLRSQGFSQQEVARRLSLDRSFISRLEAIGEIRKGKRVAAIGFPIKNKEELSDVCHEFGLDMILFLSNEERWALAGEKKAIDFFNEMMELIAQLRGFDTLIMVTSEKWYHLAEALLDMQIIFIKLGATPVHEDRPVDPALFRETLNRVIDIGSRGEGKE